MPLPLTSDCVGVYTDPGGKTVGEGGWRGRGGGRRGGREHM